MHRGARDSDGSQLHRGFASVCDAVQREQVYKTHQSSIRHKVNGSVGIRQVRDSRAQVAPANVAQTCCEVPRRFRRRRACARGHQTEPRADPRLRDETVRRDECVRALSSAAAHTASEAALRELHIRRRGMLAQPCSSSVSSHLVRQAPASGQRSGGPTWGAAWLIPSTRPHWHRWRWHIEGRRRMR